MLHGRETEKATIAEVLASARLGEGASLAVLGEAGAGKSSLLRDVARQAALGMTVVTTSGIESEAPLAFAALQRLLRPLTARLDAVPSPQARALRVAFGEEAGEVGDRFLVYMGVLSLLAAAAEETPVLAIVDDAQCSTKRPLLLCTSSRGESRWSRSLCCGRPATTTRVPST